MRAFFIHNAQAQAAELADFELVVCSSGFDPNRVREYAKPDAKLFAYVNFETVGDTPWDVPTYEAVFAAVARKRYLYEDAGGGALSDGWIPGTTAEGYDGTFYSGYPWPKTPENLDRPKQQWDLKLSFGRARAHVDAYIETISGDWDGLYVDQCRPMPRYVHRRMTEVGLLDDDFLFWTQRSEALQAFILQRLHTFYTGPIIGNTTGWQNRHLSGITIEAGHQTNVPLTLASFIASTKSAVRLGRGVFNVDWNNVLEAVDPHSSSTGDIYRGYNANVHG